VLLRRALGEEMKRLEHTSPCLVARYPSALSAYAERSEPEARRGARSDSVARVSFGWGLACYARAVEHETRTRVRLVNEVLEGAPREVFD
jgi:hypothetical protein